MAKPVNLQEMADYWVSHWWQIAVLKFGNKIGTEPKVIINKRLTSTAGRAFVEKGYIDLSEYLFSRNIVDFCDNTIPHELAHMIAFRLYKDHKHGKAWKYVAHTLYGDNSRTHDYETKFEAQRKKANGS